MTDACDGCSLGRSGRPVGKTGGKMKEKTQGEGKCSQSRQPYSYNISIIL